MKKARQQPANEYWDKKLLEAEEKDPNRWKHTGYKKMYVNGNPIQSRKSRSPIRKTPISPRIIRHPQSPIRRRMSRTPDRYRERYARKSPPRVTEMKSNKEMYMRAKRPMSPPPKVMPSTSSKSQILSFFYRHEHPQYQAALTRNVPVVAVTMIAASSSPKDLIVSIVMVR